MMLPVQTGGGGDAGSGYDRPDQAAHLVDNKSIWQITREFNLARNTV